MDKKKNSYEMMMMGDTSELYNHEVKQLILYSVVCYQVFFFYI